MKFRYREDHEMKDSGVEWIGKIPKDWEVKNFKRSIRINNGKEIIEINKPMENNINVYGSGGVFKYTSEYLYDRESVLFGRKGTIGKPIYVNEQFWTVDTMYYTTFEKNVFPKVFYYIFLVYPWNMITTQTALPSIVGSDVLNSKYATPDKSIQEKIASFLDEKTTHFDSIISKKEALIKRLEEAKKSLISEVVTGKVKIVKTDSGFELVQRNEDEMKDSGVEWLGKIPKEWETKRIKYLFELRNERNKKAMDEVQILSLYTALGVRKQGEVEARGNKVMTVEDYKKVYPNDIVVNIILAWMGAIGMSEYEGVISPAYDIYKPTSKYVNSKYYHYVFRTGNFSGECYKYGRGIMSMRWRTYSDEFKSIFAPNLSIEEQNLIVRFLEKRMVDIDNLINKTKKQIEKLKEAKQSLISEAVTGKIEILDN